MNIEAIVEKQRKFWEKIAQKNNWKNKDNIFVQVWFNEDGSVNDSVSTLNLDRNYFILVNEDRDEIADTADIKEAEKWFK